jgi:hypothetical protein
VLGAVGSILALVAAWLSTLGEADPRGLLLAAASCPLGLWGIRLAWLGRHRWAALLLLAALLGLGFGIGETALIPGALLLLAAVLALLGR